MCEHKFRQIDAEKCTKCGADLIWECLECKKQVNSTALAFEPEYNFTKYEIKRVLLCQDCYVEYLLTKTKANKYIKLT